MNKYADLAKAPVPQSELLDTRQVSNNAGGYVFALDDWARLDRFLILGSDAPTYYQSARDLTRENATCVERCYALDPARTVARIVEISDSGRAPRNDAAIFALALGAADKDVKVRQSAVAGVPKVCRTATHLFQFVDCARALGRGWGRTLKRAVARWYEHKSAEALGYQAIKYRSRERYTHKRLLRTAHPKADGPAKEALYRWICGKDHDVAALAPVVRAHVAAMKSASEEALLHLVREYRLPWEAVPTEATTNPKVWAAMLPVMGLTALVRNLGQMTSLGVLAPFTPELAIAVNRLLDASETRRSRVHPFAVLQALAVYRSGRGVRGGLAWEPAGAVMDALDCAFYLAFANVQPTNRRTLVALDVSGSMGSPMWGSPLSVREAGAALALVAAKTEPNHHIVGFSAAMPGAWVASRKSRHGWYGAGKDGDGISPLPFGARTRLDDAVRAISEVPFGATDCALPMLYASALGLDVDVFVVLTDNETWAGAVHPAQALRDYRRNTGIAAKLIVVGMTSTGFSIADPGDGGMLDVVGFDAAAPVVMADFARESNAAN